MRNFIKEYQWYITIAIIIALQFAFPAWAEIIGKTFVGIIISLTVITMLLTHWVLATVINKNDLKTGDEYSLNILKKNNWKKSFLNCAITFMTFSIIAPSWMVMIATYSILYFANAELMRARIIGVITDRLAK